MLLVPREAATDLYTLYPTYTLAAPVTSTPLASIRRLMVCRRACRTHGKGAGCRFREGGLGRGTLREWSAGSQHGMTMPVNH